MSKRSKQVKNMHVVYDPQVMWVLSSPIRVEVLGAICAIGSCSVADIADHTGRTRTSLYPHIEQLLEAGLVLEGEVRLSGKRYEQLYEPIARAVGTKHQWDDPENVAYHQAYGNAVGRLMSRMHERATADPKAVIRGDARDTHAGYYNAWVDDKALKEINKHVDAIRKIALESRPDDDHRLVNIGILMSNDRRKS
mgnify:FL=1